MDRLLRPRRRNHSTESRREKRVSHQGTVTYELIDSVAWLGLNRPHKRNAIDSALLADLRTAVGRAQEQARVLVIFGHGICFSAREGNSYASRGRVTRVAALAILAASTQFL